MKFDIVFFSEWKCVGERIWFIWEENNSFQTFLYKQKENYCDYCDKTVKIKLKNEHFKSLTNNEFEKNFWTKHTIQNIGFFHIVSVLNNYITNHNTKFQLYCVKDDFLLFS